MNRPRPFALAAVPFLLLAVLLAPTALWPQTGQRVTVNPYPATPAPVTVVPAVDGSGNPLYICSARPFGPWNNGSVPASFSWTRAATTLTNIVDSSNTATATTSSAHGLRPGNSVTVAGTTTDADLNGTYVILTVPTATTFTFTSASVTDATYTDATMTLTTSAPRTTVAIWSVMKLLYDSSNYFAGSTYAGGGTETNICANYATLVYP